MRPTVPAGIPPMAWRPGVCLLRSQSERILSGQEAERILAYEQRMNRLLKAGKWEAQIVYEGPPVEVQPEEPWTVKRVKAIESICSICKDPTFPLKQGRSTHKHCRINARQIRLPHHLRKQESKS